MGSVSTSIWVVRFTLNFLGGNEWFRSPRHRCVDPFVFRLSCGSWCGKGSAPGCAWWMALSLACKPPGGQSSQAQDWQAQLTACGIDPNNLASQVFRPWEFVTHSAQSSHRERSRGAGKGGKGGKREGKHPRPQGAGPGTGKGRNW